MQPIRTEEDATELLRAVKALAVISAWNGLGLFEALTHGPQRLLDLEADPRSLRITAPILRHLGLLVGDDERVGLSPTAEVLYEQGALPSARNLEFLADHSRLLEVLRHGGPVKGDSGESKATEGGVRRDAPEQTHEFLDMLYRRSERSGQQTFAWLDPLLPRGASVLDLGGGHGRYARLFADAGHRATLFDLPHVISYARERHGDAIAFLSGDYHESTDLGGPYDLVLLSNIVHSESSEANQQLMHRLAAATRPNGYIVLKDMFLDALQQDPASAAFFGLTMLLYTREGQSPRVDHARHWLTQAGLVDIHVSTFGSYSLVRGRRR